MPAPFLAVISGALPYTECHRAVCIYSFEPCDCAPRCAAFPTESPCETRPIYNRTSTRWPLPFAFCAPIPPAIPFPLRRKFTVPQPFSCNKRFLFSVIACAQLFPFAEALTLTPIITPQCQCFRRIVRLSRPLWDLDHGYLGMPLKDF